ncbi:hypothetical protein BTH42_06960 [Burkholderia sp. SRS-W-2-2016]|uniref:hypothetical protein n=1 Tax=Burkholderia sp. SRS-W-2-2016 TaxID=1926878 RepID=UPI00094B1217|nr:hypothetical protein [Burkholderia sp. SRS-W-2-2016]OLL32187.1 hypothetical protein BTH42_06960 [Burkholderia sp. SRS-W-2-2016]
MVTIFEESGKAEVKERRGGSRCAASRYRGVKLHRALARYSTAAPVPRSWLHIVRQNTSGTSPKLPGQR